MFENISKGEFTTSLGGEFVVRKTGNVGVPIVQTFNKMEEDFENFEPNAEFIAYCFNLQQRYDIGKFEKLVWLLEQQKSCLDAGFDISVGSVLHDKIDNLLKQIKK